MNKFIKVLLVLILLVTVTACGNKTTKEEVTDALKFKQEYESLNGTIREKDNKKIRDVSIPEDNPIIYSTAEKISKKMDNKESFLVYFGFSDCPWCRSIIEELIQVAKDNNIGVIYYVDVKEIRDVKELNEDNEIITTTEGSKGYNELIEKMSNILADYQLEDEDGDKISTGERRIYAPNVVAVSKGKAIELEEGNSDKQTDPYQKLTSKMKKETYNKFKCLIKCLEEDSTTCKKDSC